MQALKDFYQDHNAQFALRDIAVYTGTAFLTVFLLRSLYCVTLHPLSRVPGPLLAKFSYAWLSWRYLKGNWHRDICRLHEEYGPVVRIASNLVSVIDQEPINSYFGIGKNATTKTSWYHVWRVTPEKWKGVFDDDEKVSHGISRKRVANAFAMSSILSMEDIVQSSLARLWSIFEEYSASQEMVHLEDWVSLYAFDVVSCLGGYGLPFLEKRGDIYGLQSAIKELFIVASRTGFYQFLTLPALITRAIIAKIKGQDAGIDAFMAFLSKNIGDRVANFQPAENMNLVDYSIAARDADGKQFPMLDILLDAANLLGAGADTTSIGMRAVICQLLTHPEIMRQLQRDLDDYKRKNNLEVSHQLTYNQVIEIPLLIAVVQEASRLHPSIVWNLPRIVPAGGAVANGFHLAAGTEISFSPYSANRSKETWGPDANEFKPQRWLGDNAKALDKKLVTFGSGSRVCLGKNLALTQMKLFTAQLFDRFDLTLMGPWREHSYWFSQQEDLNVKVKLRHS